MKRPALQNKQVVLLRMAFRARKALGTFEKRAPGFLNFRLTNTTTWLWRWLPHRLSKRQSITTVLLRTPITQMIFFNQGMLLLGSNHFLINVNTFKVIEACLSSFSKKTSFEPYDRSFDPMWQAVIIDTFFTFWSFLVAEQNFNFRFQCPCYKHSAHA